MNGFTNTGSREVSPLSTAVMSQGSSPSALFNNSPSPAAHDIYNGKVRDAGSNQAWTYFGYPQNGFAFPHSGLANMSMATMAPSQGFPGMGPPHVLLIHPTPLKSRVETQIPIKLSLFPMPVGIKKLHLPTHTISKPKLLARPVPERSPDTLELYTTLVCTSAMRNPAYRQRAFARAATATRESDKEDLAPESADDDDDSKPLNGGDVKICVGCITRERKRAARKKVKKVEEEESWHKDEAKRVIVFNAQEVKDWQPPTSQSPSEGTGDRPDPFIPEGAMQVDAPMRIACYCRHQNEKLGFQVIFTIKDHQDRLIAQEITNSIMITDDHKTHNVPTLPTRSSIGSDGLFPGSGAYTMDNAYNMSGPAGGASSSASPLSADLQAMQNLNMQFQNASDIASSQPSQVTSTTVTPRTLSRQTSPSTGPTSKKRKASGVPSGLAMTKLETPEASASQSLPPAPMSTTTPTVPSPFTTNLQPFSPADAIAVSLQPFGAGPLSPNSSEQLSNANRSRSLDNLVIQPQMFSAPTSGLPSRTSSPNGSSRNNAQLYHQHQAQLAQAVASGLYSIPLNLNPHRPPTIHKLIPNEGPRAGGIEVTCLGSGFCQGLEVMFGDSKATTTTFWGETSLVCLLPPSAFAGTVPVTFMHQHQAAFQAHFPSAITKQLAHFKYVDDDEQQIIRTALAVLGHKMTGKMEDVRDLARRIVGDGNSNWGASTSGAGQNQNISNFNSASFGIDVEATLLRCLDLIDLDDSPNMPRLNMRRASGQTMLHLACSLGLNRFVAALLARGANPEPRDKGGFTPMHFAALHNHPQIVRRLVLSGADPTIRSLQGYTPSDMATSEEVVHAARRIERHRRSLSASSLKSRASSATSLRSVWEPSSTPSLARSVDSSDDSDGDEEYEDEDADTANEDAFWMRSARRPSAQKARKESIADEKDPILDLPPDIGPTGGLVSPAAAMTAFRDQLTTHIQQLQQTMHLNFPNLPNLPQLPPLPPMPTLAMMPALPDYQAYLPTAPMVRRIGNLVGNRGDGAHQQDYRWWDLFSSNVATAPPAYEDIFPVDQTDAKRASAAQAAADTVADNKCVELFDRAEGSTVAESSTSAQKRPVKLETVHIGQKHSITKEQQEQLRLAHAEKVKRLSRDRNLFFIWVCSFT